MTGGLSQEDLVAKYIWGDMSEEEKNSFEARLKVDEALRAELELQQSLQTHFKTDQLKQEFEEKVRDAYQYQTRRNWIIGLGSLILVSLIAWGIWSFLQPQKPYRANSTPSKNAIASDSVNISGLKQDTIEQTVDNKEEEEEASTNREATSTPPVADQQSASQGQKRQFAVLADKSVSEFFREDFLAFQHRSSGGNLMDSLLKQADDFFAKEQWSSALEAYNQISRDSLSQKSTDFLKYGMAYYRQGAVNDAIDIFQEIKNNDQAFSFNRDLAEWYTLICHLSSDQIAFEQALEQALKNKESDYRERIINLEKAYLDTSN